MIRAFTISLVQTPLYWQDAQANRAMIEEKIWSLSGKTDLILLPEMFTTGFSNDTEKLFETMNLHTHKWLVRMADQTGAAIGGSLVIRDEGKYYNRFLCVSPGGKTYTYDKRHLFSLSEEDRYFSSGNDRTIMEIKGVKLMPIICYDLRFPEGCRNHYSPERGLEYDVLLVSAHWPEVRIQAWDTLLQARAIENHCYAAGCTVTGVDGLGINYAGHSAIYGPKGETLAFSEDEEILTVQLDIDALAKHREQFPFYKDNRI